MSWIAVGVGAAAAIGGGVMSMEGSKSAARSAGRAARAQMDEARRVRRESMDFAGQAGSRLRALSEATPDELRRQERGLAMIGQSIEGQKKLLEAVDPSLLEASKQVLSLLRGDNASSLNPVMAQRQQQRQQLLNSLRAQYGPGAETSALGRKMLSQFDMQTNMMTSQVQQGQLGSLMNTMTGLNNNRPDLVQALGGEMAYGDLLRNRMRSANQNADTMMMNAMMGTNQALIDTAGGQYLGGQLRGRANAQMGQSISNLGMTLMGGAMTRGKPKPTPNTYTPGAQEIDPSENISLEGDLGGGDLYSGMGRRKSPYYG